MTIETKEGRFFVAHYFAAIPGSDIMWVLYRDEGETEWTIRGRIRLYVNDTLPGEEDVKQWFQVTREGSMEDVETFADTLYNDMFTGTDGLGTLVRELIRRATKKIQMHTADTEQVVRIILKQPNSHVVVNAAGGVT